MKGKKIMAEDKLQRELSNRHIQLIAIGGAIYRTVPWIR